MINFEEIKQQLDPKEILEKMKSISKGDLIQIEKLVESKRLIVPVSVIESRKEGTQTEGFNLVDQGESDNNQIFVVDRILERIRKIVEFIRFPEYPQEMQEVLGEINRVVRFTRHYSILAPDIAFCQKHSIFVVKSNTSMSSEFSFVLPLIYKPATVNGRRIVSPSMPSKKLFLVIPCYSNLKKDESERRYLSYSINKDNIRVVTSGGRSFRTYHSFYYRGSMRVHVGNLSEELSSPYDIVGVRDQMQNDINDIKTDQVGGIPKGYPAISDIVLDISDIPDVLEREGTSEENENVYVSLGSENDDIDSNLVETAADLFATRRRQMRGWSLDDDDEDIEV